MPYHVDDTQYLRSKAAQFRWLAEEYTTPVSARLREMACELDQKADEIERHAHFPGKLRHDDP